jgi:transposase
MIDPENLPDDVEALKAMILASHAEIANKDALIERKEDRIERLEKLVADFKRALFGARSEKAAREQYDLALEDIETAIAAVHAEDDAENVPPTTGKRKTNRGSLPKHLPRIEEVIEPDQTICSCGATRHIIGEDVSERLDIVPAQFTVIVTRRPKYACRSCEDGIVQAPAPASLIPGGMPSEAIVAHVLVSKYADHLPLYRQAQIYSRQGIHLDRSTLASWVGKAAYELAPVFDGLIQNLKQSSKLFMDETTAPVLDPGRGKTKTGYFWALARDDRPWSGNDPPGVAFTYAPGRSGQYAEDILQGFSGIVQVDGYAGYNRLLRRADQSIQLAYCWAHARRKLHEIAKNSTAPIAQAGLKQIAALYRIETDIRGQSPEARLAVRQEYSAPKIKAFKEWLRKHRAQVSGKSPLGEALKYIAKYWDGLCLFLSDGRIEMDNNAVERNIRPIALNRKNALFAGHDAGAKNWAIIASLIETCKLNTIEPHSYLTATLKAIVNGHKQSQIEKLLPWNYNTTV